MTTEKRRAPGRIGLRNETLSLRLSKSEKEIIAEAAEYSGFTKSDFGVNASIAEARKILKTIKRQKPVNNI